MLRNRILNAQHARWLKRVYLLRKKWLAGAAKIGIGVACLQFAVVRPLTHKTDSLAAQMQTVGQRMDLLASGRSQVENANDLLTALAAQESSLQQARQALSQLRLLRLGVEDEARKVAAAQEQIQALLSLPADVARAGERLPAVHTSLGTLESLNRRVIEAGQLAETGLHDVDRAARSIEQLSELKSHVLSGSENVEVASRRAEELGSLCGKLSNPVVQVEAAREHGETLLQLATSLGAMETSALTASCRNADQLLAMQSALSAVDAAPLAAAERNLRQLFSIRDELSRGTTDVVAAIENLELLRGFQRELSLQLSSLEKMRVQLSEVALLRETVARVRDAVAPLTELSSLKRLSDPDVRAIARQILDHRTAQAEPELDRARSDSVEPTSNEGTVTRLAPQPRD